MITQEQIEKLCNGARWEENVLAVLTRNYKSSKLSYILLKGTVVELVVYSKATGDLIVDGRPIDLDFPYDAAELLDDN